MKSSSSPSCIWGKHWVHAFSISPFMSSQRLRQPPLAVGFNQVFWQDACWPNWELCWRPDEKEVLKTVERQVATLASLEEKKKKKPAFQRLPPTSTHLQETAAWGPVCSVWPARDLPKCLLPVWPSTLGPLDQHSPLTKKNTSPLLLK